MILFLDSCSIEWQFLSLFPQCPFLCNLISFSFFSLTFLLPKIKLYFLLTHELGPMSPLKGLETITNGISFWFLFCFFLVCVGCSNIYILHIYLFFAKNIYIYVALKTNTYIFMWINNAFKNHLLLCTYWTHI